MLPEGLKIGFALTGSFCTLRNVIPEIKRLKDEGAHILPIISASIANTDTRFGDAGEIISMITEITGKKPISTIKEAEPIGPGNMTDIIVVAPCTGNTLGKLAAGITDTAVTMAVKASLRNLRPVVIAISTNDGLGANAQNIGFMLDKKNIFFVPFRQDDPLKKRNSIVAKFDLILPTIKEALKGSQIQPLLY
jgi:dipicolinate synthase subunit B